tara:strand:- start:6681 stop:7457 length:777 start_codon:yes stop_codon:yes gene_type:complete
MKSLRVHIKGEAEGIKISPSSTDISEIKTFISDIESLVRGDFHGNDKPKVVLNSFEDGSLDFNVGIEEGLKTEEFFQHISSLHNNMELDPLLFGSKRANVLFKWQKIATQNDLNFLIGSDDIVSTIQISSETDFKIVEPKVIKSEIILFGLITDIGGKNNPNIHITTEKFGEVLVSCTKDKIRQDDVNRLYKKFGIRTNSLVNIRDKEILESEFIQFIDKPKKLTKEKLNNFINKSKTFWDEIEDPVLWVREQRGEYD